MNYIIRLANDVMDQVEPVAEALWFLIAAASPVLIVLILMAAD